MGVSLGGGSVRKAHFGVESCNEATQHASLFQSPKGAIPLPAKSSHLRRFARQHSWAFNQPRCEQTGSPLVSVQPSLRNVANRRDRGWAQAVSDSLQRFRPLVADGNVNGVAGCQIPLSTL